MKLQSITPRVSDMANHSSSYVKENFEE